jgi:hypothetical protein
MTRGSGAPGLESAGAWVFGRTPAAWAWPNTGTPDRAAISRRRVITAGWDMKVMYHFKSGDALSMMIVAIL